MKKRPVKKEFLKKEIDKYKMNKMELSIFKYYNGGILIEEN